MVLVQTYGWMLHIYIPGKDNKAADSQSRKINLDAEWKLNPNFIANALEVLHFEPNVDLFASGINFQYKDYFSF